jgi:transposase-like protein
MSALPEHVRFALLARYRQTPNFSLIARELGIDYRTVAKWVRRHEEEGGVAIKPRSGRPRAVSVAAARKGKDHLMSNLFDNCHQVAKALHSEGLTDRIVHSTTLSRRVKAQAELDGDEIQAYCGTPKKALSDANKAQRLAFCKANKTKNWGRVMVTDRKKFLFRYPGTRVTKYQWSRKGAVRQACRPNHPSVVNMYAGLTIHGVTKPVFVTGTSGLHTNYKNKKGEASKNITAAEYKTVLEEGLLKCGERIFQSAGLDSWVFQQDNDPTHRSSAPAAIQAWNSRGRLQVQLLQNWPANSPDLSPIENAWAIVQAKVDAAGCQTFEEFQETLKRTWNELPLAQCRNLMGSMQGRLKKCIVLKGGKTAY